MIEKDNNILIICPSMWPKMNSWGETQRMYYLANSLVKHGYNVYTVSPEYDGNPTDEEAREKYYTCYFMGKRRSIDAESEVSKRAENNRKAGGAVRRTIATAIFPMIRWIYNEPSYVEGIIKQIWLIKYQKDICSIIQENRICKVIISVPEFVLLRCGKIIRKRFPNVTVFYDYRDPWYLWNKEKNLAYYREKKYLSYANYVIGFSESFCRDMIQEMGIPQEKVFLVYNGYSEKDWRLFEKRHLVTHKEKKGKLRLTYTGYLSLVESKSNYRNLNSLIRIIKKYQDIELFLVGVKDKKIGIVEDNVYYIGNVQQIESFSYMAESDVLLSIHDTTDCSGNYLISGKFFDYIRSKKVIWHIGASQGLMSSMIHSNHLGVTCENTEKELEETLCFLLEYWKRGEIEKLRDCTQCDISYFSREYQNARYSNILHYK